MAIYEKLMKIQSKLNVPKNQYNSFGKYHYRSCEDILTAVKPLLAEEKLILTLSDEVVETGGRVYVKATAKLTDCEPQNPQDIFEYINTAYAREDESKKGMDGAQITGTASSYARKYALNGLFAIDDSKDPDTDEYKNQQNNAPGEKADGKLQNKAVICPKCKKEVKPSKDRNGVTRSPEEVLQMCGNMCIDCAKAAKSNKNGG